MNPCYTNYSCTVMISATSPFHIALPGSWCSSLHSTLMYCTVLYCTVLYTPLLYWHIAIGLNLCIHTNIPCSLIMFNLHSNITNITNIKSPYKHSIIIMHVSHTNNTFAPYYYYASPIVTICPSHTNITLVPY